jgi:precorrin-2 dehydrogenase/sirohydrochlorin ferrochelatase
MVPLVLDLSGRRVVIFGGGTVGHRKAAFFAGEADVTAVSRSFTPVFDTLSVRKVVRDLEGLSDRDLAGLLEGAFLAVAATDNAALNDRIGGMCRASGIHFNSAWGTPGDVILPAVFQGKHHAIAITTFGKAPGMARFLRKGMETEYPGLDPMIELVEQLRAYLKGRVPDQAGRQAIIARVLADREVWDAVTGGGERAWALVEQRYLHGR